MLHFRSLIKQEGLDGIPYKILSTAKRFIYLVIPGLEQFELFFSFLLLEGEGGGSYGHYQALLAEKDLACPSVHYFRHKQAPEKNHRHISLLDSILS
jgi:hypothetical protein